MVKKILLVILCVGLLGCAQIKKKSRHFKSNLVGLDRTITLYAMDGSVIRQWDCKAKIEIKGNVISFIDENDKEIKLSGTAVIEQN